MTLEAAVGGAVGLISPVSEREIPLATARMRKSASRFGSSRIWSSSGIAATVVVILWLSFLGAGARRNLYRMIVAEDAEVWWSSVTQEEDLPCLELPGVDGESIQSAMMADQEARMPAARFLINPYPRDRTETLRRWRALWDASPQDPALFFVYSMAYLKEKAVLPPDFVTTGERLDPGNGWFRFCSVAVSMDEALERDNSRGGLPYTITDQAKLNALIEDLERASAMPKWEDYRQRLFQMASVEWPVPDDLPDQVFSHLTFQAIPMAMEEHPLNLLRMALQIWLGEAEKSADPQDLTAAAVRFDALCRHWCDCEGGYTAREWQRMAARKGAEVLAAAYWARRDPANQAKYNGIAAALFAVAPQGYQWTYHAQAGILARSNSAAFDRPRGIAPDELRPGRLAEYVMWERMFFQGAAGAMALLALGCLFLPRLERKRVGLLPLRLGGFLSVRDRLLACLIGIGIPVAVYLLTRNGSVGGREIFLSQNRCVMLLCQVAGLFVSAALLMGSSLGWSLGRKAAAVGFQQRRTGISVAMAMSGLLSIPIAGWLPGEFTRQKLEGPYAYWCAGLLAALPLVWLLIRAAGCFLSPPERRRRRLVIARSCAPLFGVMGLLSLVAVGRLHSSERALVRQMDFESVRSPDHGRISTAHLEKADQIRSVMEQQFKP